MLFTHKVAEKRKEVEVNIPFSFLNERFGRFAWRLTTGFAFIKMARLKAIIAIILLVGLGECARDLTKCVVCKKTLTWS